MFLKPYDQLVCKNEDELVYANSVAIKKLKKKGLSDKFIREAKYPVNLFLYGGVVGWTNQQDRVGNKVSFVDFVIWEQRITASTSQCETLNETKSLRRKQITEKDVEQALFILKSLNELADSEKLDFKIRAGIKTSIKNICGKSLFLLKYNKF